MCFIIGHDFVPKSRQKSNTKQRRENEHSEQKQFYAPSQAVANVTDIQLSIHPTNFAHTLARTHESKHKRIGRKKAKERTSVDGLLLHLTTIWLFSAISTARATGLAYDDTPTHTPTNDATEYAPLSSFPCTPNVP